MSKTGTIRRRSKWLSLPTPDLFSRLCARTTNNKAARSRKRGAVGTNVGPDSFGDQDVSRAYLRLRLRKFKNANPLRLRYRTQPSPADDDHPDDDGCPFRCSMRRVRGIGA